VHLGFGESRRLIASDGDQTGNCCLATTLGTMGLIRPHSSPPKEPHDDHSWSSPLPSA
jgi:hypothetical protein